MESDSEGDFDIEIYDDDWQLVADEKSETLIPFGLGKEYDQLSSCYLSAWATSCRDVRKAVQTTGAGLDQKEVGRLQKGRNQKKGNSKPHTKIIVKNESFRPNLAPKKNFPNKMTAFKTFVCGATKRGTPSQLFKVLSL